VRVRGGRGWLARKHSLSMTNPQPQRESITSQDVLGEGRGAGRRTAA